MPESSDDQVEARVRPRRWFAWVWVVPIGAAAIVLWLGWRAIADRGPAITISFRAAEGLQAGQTKIQHRNVDVGTVESLELTPDMSRAIVHVRMTRVAAPYLNDNTRFYIVAPRVSFGEISGLSTIVSGTYIEMSPGKDGNPRRQFIGLDEPPVPPADTPGRSFVLRAPDLGSLRRGSPISYHGVDVGEVEAYTLDDDGERVKVTAFIRSPYDRLVHPETRFWNAGGVDVSVGAQGVRFRATSWQQLLAGGVAFETPPAALAGAPSTASAVFDLYDNRRSALRIPRGPELTYIADFLGNLRGVENGTPVELQGTEVGEVKEAHLKYDERRHTLVTSVTLSINPEKVEILDMPRPTGADRREVASEWLEKLVAHGLRAQVAQASFLTGLKLITLEMVPNAPPAHMVRVGRFERIPSVTSGDLTEILQSLRGVLQNVDRATAGPQLGHALQSLDQTLTHLDQITGDLEPDLKSLVKSLRETADATQSTLTTVQGMLGNNAATDTDLPRLMRELTQAARAVRGLADYLDRHPEALLRGRKGDER